MTTDAATRAAVTERAQTEFEAIAALSDPIGVLSVYVDADPALAAGPRPAWQTPVRAGLRRLAREARHTRPPVEWTAIKARLAELEPEIEALLDPRPGRRGRSLFAAVGDREIHRVALHAPLAAHVSLHRGSCGVPTPLRSCGMPTRRIASVRPCAHCARRTDCGASPPTGRDDRADARPARPRALTRRGPRRAPARHGAIGSFPLAVSGIAPAQCPRHRRRCHGRAARSGSPRAVGAAALLRW